MWLLLTIAGVTLVLTWKVLGLSIWCIFATITTGMFCARKIGYAYKMQYLITLEGLGGFLTIMLRLILGSFSLKTVILTVILRLILLGTAYYDNVTYIYITKEERKE